MLPWINSCSGIVSRALDGTWYMYRRQSPRITQLYGVAYEHQNEQAENRWPRQDWFFIILLVDLRLKANINRRWCDETAIHKKEESCSNRHAFAHVNDWIIELRKTRSSRSLRQAASLKASCWIWITTRGATTTTRGYETFIIVQICNMYISFYTLTLARLFYFCPL